MKTHNHASERAIIGLAFRNPPALTAFGLVPENFHALHHREVWRAMIAVAESGNAMEPSLVISQLEASGTLGAVGNSASSGGLRVSGEEWIYAIAESEFGDLSSAEYHAEVVIRDALTRSTLSLHSELVEKVSFGVTGLELISHAAERLREISLVGQGERLSSVSGWDLIRELAAEVSAAAFKEHDESGEEQKEFVTSGLDRIDDAIGGHPRATVTVIAAKTSHGKSAYILQAAKANARAGEYSLILSAEDLRSDTGYRLLGQSLRIAASSLKRRCLTDEEKQRLTLPADLEWTKRIRIVSVAGMDARRVVATARMFQAGQRYSFVAYDYLQRVAIPRSRRMSRNDAHIEAMNLFDDAAKRDGAAWLVGSQFRKTESDEPDLEDLRGAGEISDIAKLIVFLNRPGKGTSRDNSMRIWTPKSSNDGYIDGLFGWNGPLMEIEQGPPDDSIHYGVGDFDVPPPTDEDIPF